MKQSLQLERSYYNNNLYYIIELVNLGVDNVCVVCTQLTPFDDLSQALIKTRLPLFGCCERCF